MAIEEHEALALESRRRIYSIIAKNPGLHFRELQRRTSIAIGALQYHTDFLKKSHLIRAEKDGKFVRFFPIREKQLEENNKLLPLLRHDSLRKIIIFLLTKKTATNKLISQKTGMAPSTVSWHLNSLLTQNIVVKKTRGRKSLFSLVDKDQIANILIHHKKSFLDELVDNFVEVWQEYKI